MLVQLELMMHHAYAHFYALDCTHVYLHIYAYGSTNIYTHIYTHVYTQAVLPLAKLN